MLADGDRAVIVDWSGGMMDIGWAQHARADLLGPATAFVRDSQPFSNSFAALLDALRAALTRIEREHRRYCTAGVVALEGDAHGWRIGRLGALRCVGLGHDGGATIIGHENVLALAPDVPPMVVAAALMPAEHVNRPSDVQQSVPLTERMTRHDRHHGRSRSRCFGNRP